MKIIYGFLIVFALLLIAATYEGPSYVEVRNCLNSEESKQWCLVQDDYITAVHDVLVVYNRCVDEPMKWHFSEKDYCEEWHKVQWKGNDLTFFQSVRVDRHHKELIREKLDDMAYEQHKKCKADLLPAYCAQELRGVT